CLSSCTNRQTRPGRASAKFECVAFPTHSNQHFEQVQLNTKVMSYLERVNGHLHKTIDSTGHVEKVSDKSFILTSIGKQILLTYNRELKRSNSERFISPQKEYVLQNTYSKYDIYLPPDLKILD